MIILQLIYIQNTEQLKYKNNQKFKIINLTHKNKIIMILNMIK